MSLKKLQKLLCCIADNIRVYCSDVERCESGLSVSMQRVYTTATNDFTFIEGAPFGTIAL